MTNYFVINRSALCIDNNIDIGRFTRNYKNVWVAGNNELIYTLPESLETLKLEIYDGFDLKTLKRFKKLKNLSIFGNNVAKDTSNPTNFVLGLQSLEVTNLDEGTLDVIQELIRANGSINTLSLKMTTLDEDFYEGEFNDFMRNIHLPNLREFSIEARTLNLESGLMEFLQNHRCLEVCEFCNMNIGDVVVEELRKNCENLKRVSLKRCLQLGGKTLNNLGLMRKLEHLDLTNTNFSAEDLGHFNSRQLKYFKICFSSEAAIGGLSSPQTQSLLQSMTNMRVLDLYQLQSHFGGPILDYTILPFISKQMPNLVELDLGGNFAICEDLALKDKLVFNKLEKLNLSSTELTDELLCLIYAPKLRSLDMGESEITTRGVHHIVRNSPLIEDLQLERPYNLHVSDVRYISEHLPFLRKLDLGHFRMDEELLKHLMLETSIENCKCFIRGDYEEYAKWKEGFKAAEYNCYGLSRMRGGSGYVKKWKITNGVRNFLFI